MPTSTANVIKEVLSDRKNSNKIVDLIFLLNIEQKEKTLHTVLDGVGVFFIRALKNGDFMQQKSHSTDIEIYQTWVKERYKECNENIHLLFDHESAAVKEHCIVTAMKFLENEITNCFRSDSLHFPEVSTSRIVTSLIKYDVANTSPIVCSYLWKLADFRYFTLKCISKCVTQLIEKGDGKDTVLQNAFALLKSISECMPKTEEENKLTLAENGFIAIPDTNYSVMEDANVNTEILAKAIPKTLDIKEQRKVFGNIWLEFLSHDLCSHLFKSVLILLENHIIPNFASPCLLADFLTRSFSQGGGIALLSLHGLFILMNEHNLEYPQFYTHLYSMVHPRIFDAKYQSRFFYLLNLFLSSTHLPAYLIAAFAKRLARLTLVAPTNSQQLLVNFILTLVDRHPSIKILINRKNLKGVKIPDVKNDPYIPNHPDPVQCNAMESSLWELSALGTHYLPEIVSAVKDIDKGPKQDITDLLEHTYEDVFESLQGKKIEDAPMNYNIPDKIFGGCEDVVMELWSI